MNTQVELIIKSVENNAYTYNEYKTLVKSLFDKGEATSLNDMEGILNYTKLNISRMKRLDKTTKLTDEVVKNVKSIKRKIEWVVLTEGWCGDAAQNIPIINKIAELNDNIELKFILRDQNKEVMSHFLTNGGEAIPKLIQIEDDEITNTWGPRPTNATKMVNDYKKEHGKLTPEFKQDLQVWYNEDKGLDTINDLMNILGL